MKNNIDNFHEMTGCIESFMGDEGCDDSQNTAACEFDKGDCCMPRIDKSQCEECFCYKTGREHPDIVVATTTTE
jgi:hypothetical protein